MVSRTVRTQGRLVKLFGDWVRRSPRPSRYEFQFVDYLADLPIIRELYTSSLPSDKTTHQILRQLRHSLDRLEELAQVIFFMAVEETMPGELDRFPEPRWVDACAISLDPASWESDGLFRPQSEARDLTPLETEIRSLFKLRRVPEHV